MSSIDTLYALIYLGALLLIIRFIFAQLVTWPDKKKDDDES